MEVKIPSYLEPDSTQAMAKVLAWLETASIEERHWLVNLWNWDYGIAPLQWVLLQKDTAIETAASIFWSANPTDYFYTPISTYLASAPSKVLGLKGSEVRNNAARFLANTIEEAKKQGRHLDEQLESFTLMSFACEACENGHYTGQGYYFVSPRRRPPCGVFTG